MEQLLLGVGQQNKRHSQPATHPLSTAEPKTNPSTRPAELVVSCASASPVQPRRRRRTASAVRAQAFPSLFWAPRASKYQQTEWAPSGQPRKVKKDFRPHPHLHDVSSVHSSSISRAAEDSPVTLGALVLGTGSWKLGNARLGPDAG